MASRVPLLAGLLVGCGGADEVPGVDGGLAPAPAESLIGRWVHESDVVRSVLEFQDGGAFVERRDGDEIARGSFRSAGYRLELDEPADDGTVFRERLRFYVVDGDALGLHAFLPSGDRGDGLVGTWLSESSTASVDEDGVRSESGERIRLSIRVDGTFKSYRSGFRTARQDDGELVETPGDEQVLQGTWEAGDGDLLLALDGGGVTELGVLGDREALSPVVYDPSK